MKGAQTTVTPFAGRDWMQEAQDILAGKEGAPLPSRDHLQALAGAMASVTVTAALMNRALCGVLVDNGLPRLLIPAGLVDHIETEGYDLAVTKAKGSLVVELIKATTKEKVN